MSFKDDETVLLAMKTEARFSLIRTVCYCLWILAIVFSSCSSYFTWRNWT